MLKLYNTLSRKKEIFKPRKPYHVGMYVCGPTCYGPGHLGHARTYIAFDIIRRYLEYRGYKLRYIMNITDIHDDILEEAKKQKIYFQTLTNRYAKIFLKEQKKLGIKEATSNPRVTRYIPDITKFIKKLIQKKYAYLQKDSVYFNVSKFKDYGKLSGIKLKKELAGTRIKSDKYQREEAADFVLWKAVVPQWSKSGKKVLKQPGWPSPWTTPSPEERPALGRPGWHIECSVISMKYLGKQFDIHGGAQDLIFPHHENEIAQSEAGTGLKPFVRYWLHSGLLTIKGQKMSKSLGNYIEIGQVSKKWPARVIRLFVAASHYRSPLDWNTTALNQAKTQLERIDQFLDKLKILQSKKGKKWEKFKESSAKSTCKALISRTQKEFEKAMNDDFNTPAALASISKLIGQGNSLLDRGQVTTVEARNILAFLTKMDTVFNFIFWGKRIAPKIPSFVRKMVREREKARQEKNWLLADDIRRKIQRMGYKIEDTPQGPKLKKLQM